MVQRSFGKEDQIICEEQSYLHDRKDLEDFTHGFDDLFVQDAEIQSLPGLFITCLIRDRGYSKDTVRLSAVFPFTPFLSFSSTSLTASIRAFFLLSY